MKNGQYSSLKIFHHKDILDKLKCGEKVLPLYIRIKPTNLCNHRCSYCTYGAGKKENRTVNRDVVSQTDQISWSKMQEIIKDIGEMGVKAITFSGGGEPLTYPKIIETVELVKEQSIDLSLITNGQLLKGKIAELFYDAKWVRISFDSPNETEYMKIRNVSKAAFQTVCKNIEKFSKNKSKNCILGINFVISKENYQSVYKAADLVKKLGVNNIKFAAVLSNEKNYHMPIKDAVIAQIHQAQKDFSSEYFHIVNNYENDYTDKNFVAQTFSKCYTCRFITVIAADSKVYFCHTRAYDSKAVIGSLEKQSFRELWSSEMTAGKFEQLDPKRDCQNFCVYEERNKLIEDYYNVDYNHINFV